VSCEIGLGADGKIGDITVMSSLPPPITPEQLAALPPEFQALLRAVIDYYEGRISELKDEISRLKKTPKNSSLPPSTQHPHAKPAPPEKPSGKKPGGQPGHLKHSRPLVPTEECDEVVTFTPDECRRCGKRLRGCDPAPLRHQVYELPVIRPMITEYQLHRLICPGCGASTCAELPHGVPIGQNGPRMVAFAAVLMAFFRQSKRRTALFLETICNVPCSTGLTVKLQNTASAALEPAYQELLAALPTQSAVNADESPTKEGRLKAWTWVVAAAHFTVFAIRTSRKAKVIKELLTEAYAGVVTCDRAKMYLWLETIQWCWAHLKRDFQAMVDAGGAAKPIGTELLEHTAELFRHLHRARDGSLSRMGLNRHLNRLYWAVYVALEDGMRCPHAPTAATCKELLRRYDALWTFRHHVEVQPTNNVAERAVRHAVIWRKLSFGTKSAAGSRFVERLLTVIETCRQQDRNVLDFVTTSLERHFDYTQHPSLLPGV
jgi:transposase